MVMMNTPKPKPHTRWTKLAPVHKSIKKNIADKSIFTQLYFFCAKIVNLIDNWQLIIDFDADQDNYELWILNYEFC